MKWAFYIYDPKNLFLDEKKSKLWKSAYPYNSDSYSNLLNLIQETYRNFDHFALIYDGNWIFDGPANMAFYTLQYMGCPNTILNHHTTSLIDVRMRTEYNKENIDVFIDEINSLFEKFN
jgi:hypothetical protein